MTLLSALRKQMNVKKWHFRKELYARRDTSRIPLRVACISSSTMALNRIFSLVRKKVGTSLPNPNGAAYMMGAFSWDLDSVKKTNAQAC